MLGGDVCGEIISAESDHEKMHNNRQLMTGWQNNTDFSKGDLSFSGYRGLK